GDLRARPSAAPSAPAPPSAEDLRDRQRRPADHRGPERRGSGRRPVHGHRDAGRRRDGPHGLPRLGRRRGTAPAAGAHRLPGLGRRRRPARAAGAHQ
ncbi:MAG: hypothetical protein AVDCRST_MAG35-844, partial [uncultured Quadrisphaera sp.]